MAQKNYSSEISGSILKKKNNILKEFAPLGNKRIDDKKVTK